MQNDRPGGPVGPKHADPAGLFAEPKLGCRARGEATTLYCVSAAVICGGLERYWPGSMRTRIREVPV